MILQPRTSQSILVIGATTRAGAEITRALAADKAMRILLPHWGSREETLQLAAECASRGAVVLPLAATPPFESEEWDRILGRAIEDFGRLETVIFSLPQDREERKASSDSWLSVQPLEACARAAGPILRSVKPAGHFIIIGHDQTRDEIGGNDFAPLGDLVQQIAQAWAAQKSRACANLVLLSNQFPASDAVQTLRDLMAQRGVSGQIISSTEGPRKLTG